MRYKSAALIIIIVVALSAMPQWSAPQVKPPAQSSCSALEAKIATTENLLGMERNKTIACLVLQNQLTSENARLRNQLGSEQAQSAIAQQKSQRTIGVLETSGIEKDATLASEKKLNATVTAERDAALLQIKKANGRAFCKILKIGCVNPR